MKRFAVVLGASGEIGGAIARRLAESGWSLYLHWNSRPPLTLIESLAAAHPEQEFIPVQADFRTEEGADRLTGQIYDASCIVVASGQSLVKLLSDTEAKEFDELWRVHVRNPVLAVRTLSRFFHRHEKSYVIFISSVWGETGASMETAYSAVKGAQLAFVKAYAKEMAPAGTRVNAVAPGLISTKMNAGFTEAEMEELRDRIPLGIGSAEDVAEAVQYLTGGKGDYVSGHVLRINGGWYI